MTFVEYSVTQASTLRVCIQLCFSWAGYVRVTNTEGFDSPIPAHEVLPFGFGITHRFPLVD